MEICHPFQTYLKRAKGEARPAELHVQGKFKAQAARLRQSPPCRRGGPRRPRPRRAHLGRARAHGRAPATAGQLPAQPHARAL